MQKQDMEREKERAAEELRVLLDGMLLRPIASQLEIKRDELRYILVSWLEDELKKPLSSLRTATAKGLNEISELFSGLEEQLSSIDDLEKVVSKVVSRVETGFRAIESKLDAADVAVSATRADLSVISGALSSGMSLAEKQQAELRSILAHAVKRLDGMELESQRSFGRVKALVSESGANLSAKLGTERQVRSEEMGQLLQRLDAMKDLHLQVEQKMQQKVQDETGLLIQQLSEQQSILVIQQREISRLNGRIRNFFWSSLVLGLFIVGGVGYVVMQTIPQ